MKVTRAYKLRIYPNRDKADTTRYCQLKFREYTNAWLGKLFFNGNKSMSTAGLGQLANQAQHKARGIIKAQVEAAKATGNKTNVPEFRKLCCPGRIETSKSSSYSYWIKVSNLWTKGKTVSIPCLSHRKLNSKLRQGWELSSTCEVYQDKQGRPFALVFVSKEIEKAKPSDKMLGCDVGYRNSVSRSDGYIGRNSSKVIRRARQKQAEQQRQGHPVARPKSQVKQLLDIEAKTAVERCRRAKLSLAVESPRVLSNLKSGKLHGWARNYFANRCYQLAQEQQVFIWAVNPAYTSQTCSQCGTLDRRSRSGLSFCCVACGYSENADVNAAKNVAAEGTVSLKAVLARKRSGTVSDG